VPSLASLRRRAQPHARARISAIGLELTEHALHAVQLAHGNPPVLKAFASAPYPVARDELMNSPVALKNFIRTAFRDGGLSGRRVVTSLPAGDVKVMSVTYQGRPGQSDDAAIARLMQDRIGEDLSQFVIDYMPIRTEAREGDRLAMVFLSERSTVISYLEQLRKAGLDVAALEVNPVSIRRLVATLIAAEAAPENVLVINTGDLKTTLTMVSGRRLLFDQSVEFGELSLLEQIAVALDTPHDVAREIVFRHGLHPERETAAAVEGIDDTASSNMILTIARPQFSNLVAEVRRAVLFASAETRGGSIGHAYLMGSIAHWPGAAELLSQLAEMPVNLPEPLPLADALRAEHDAVPRPELVIPAGLALRGFTDA
jgi:type IV pilus assembly protein PilM